MKKFLAALAASAMALSMMSISAMAEGIDGEGDEIDDDEEIVEEVTTEEVVEEVTEATEEEVPAPALSPATGNSPVAMAVIPVVLLQQLLLLRRLSNLSLYSNQKLQKSPFRFRDGLFLLPLSNHYCLKIRL